MISNECQYILQQWQEYLKIERGYSDNTYIAYTNDLENFLTFCGNVLDKEITKTTLANITSQDLRSWITKRKINNIGANSNARALSAVRNFYRYTKQRHQINNQFVFSIVMPKKKNNLPRALSHDVIHEFLHSPTHESTWIEKRDQAIILLLYGCGVRISEALSITLKNIKNDLLYVIGKGNKERVVPILPHSKKTIKEYIELCPYLIRPDQYLFIGARGKKMSRTNFAHRLQTLRRKTGLPEIVTAHAFRHSFATHLLEQDVDIRIIQELLGHSSLSTTQNYTKINKKHLLKEYLKCYPERE